MSLLETIKQDQISARKARERDRATILTTLLSEASMVGKNDGGRETTDAEVVKVVKKFISNIDESLKISASDDLAFERSVLETYLPTQLSVEELTTVIQNTISHHNLTSPRDVGTIMKHLKESHDGLYDGALASRIAKELLV